MCLARSRPTVLTGFMDASWGGLARPYRPHYQLGNYRSRGYALGLAVDADRAPWRRALRHAARPPAARDRVAPLPVLRRVSRAGAPPRAQLLCTGSLADPRHGRRRLGPRVGRRSA